MVDSIFNDPDYPYDPKAFEDPSEQNPSSDVVYESYDDDDLKYLEFQEKIKENIANNTFAEKPFFSKKSFYFQMDKIQKIRKISKFALVSPMELYYKMLYEAFHKISNDEDKCTICLDTLYDISKQSTLDEVLIYNEKLGYQFTVLMLDKCNDHFFHIECMYNMVKGQEYIRCPVCSRIYGIQTGNMPPGTMTAYIDKNTKCSGFEKYNTIIINYAFQGGRLPTGEAYSGTSRTAYLPDSADGRKILGLLKVCFERKLTFTVGQSVTTGAKNATVWNGIHHKTNVVGGASSWGYPDPTFFSRVQEEMASKGVTEDSLDEPALNIAEKLLGGKGKSYPSKKKILFQK